MASERRGLSARARRAVQGLLSGRSLDEVAPRGTPWRAEVEAHLLASLEEPPARGSVTRRGARAARGEGKKGEGKKGERKNVGATGPGSMRPRSVVAGVAIAYSDGASRGNPGPAAIGIRILAPDGTEMWREGWRIGRATNNVAEYQGAIAALRRARELSIDELELRMDSELVVRQLHGTYRVKDATLALLKEEIDELRTTFRSVRFRHIPREENRETDSLANEALDGDAEAT